MAAPGVLSLYDLSGIQDYVFASNRLKENLGGSWLVKQALEAADTPGTSGTTPQRWPGAAWLSDAARTTDARCRVLWSGGGNAMVSSPDEHAARAVATRLSWRLANDAPGLGLVCAHVPWDGQEATFRHADTSLHEALDRHKAGRTPDALFDGLGVTAACRSTGEPASEWKEADEEDEGETGRFVGPAAAARLSAAPQAEDDLRRILELGEVNGRTLRWATDLDHLGRTSGERSYVGVLHFDGNAMGERFRKASGRLEEVEDLSRAVGKAGTEALRRALKWVKGRLPGITDVPGGGFALHEDKKGRFKDRPCFPIRPLVYGGDDITLVCDGRIALDLAAELLGAWHEATDSLPAGRAHACAGVALVKSHYPFYRAYTLAEDLCRDAKKWLKRNELQASALDWEIVRGGSVEGLAARRAKATDGSQLHARPYVVVPREMPATYGHRSWDWLRGTLIDELQRDEDFHTQYKGLARVLHEGPVPTREHLSRWKDRFPGRRLPSPPGTVLLDGFARGETPYLDALELMDFIVPWSCYEVPDAPSTAPAHAAPGNAR